LSLGDVAKHALVADAAVEFCEFGLRIGRMTVGAVDDSRPSCFADADIPFVNPADKAIDGNTGVIENRAGNGISGKGCVGDASAVTDFSCNAVLIRGTRFVETSSACPESRRFLSNEVAIRVPYESGSASAITLGEVAG